MVSQHRRALAWSLSLIVGLLLFVTACDKVPLTAPTGSVISLFASSMTVPANGEIEIIATVIENGAAPPPPTTTTPGGTTPGGTTPGATTPSATSTPGAGTPVQNGTLVSFISTIGAIEPREARTQNGEVRVRFRANGQSGTATITAYSGGASGRLENILVGTAAADHLVLSASPQTLNPAGGATTISARVEDVTGLGLIGVPVTFTADNGSLSATTAVTDQNGVAQTILTTFRETIVTANVAGKTSTVTVKLNPRTGISIAGPTTAVSAFVPVTFTVGVGTSANIRNVTVSFGDGEVRSLGAISGETRVQHSYSESGTYNVQATATEASGFTEQVSTILTILPAQPPAVIITASNSRPTILSIITLTATVSGNTSPIVEYRWDFGDNTSAICQCPQINKSWPTPGTKVIRVTVVQAVPEAPIGQGQTTVEVQPAPTLIPR